MNKLKILLVALISLSVIFTACKNNEPEEKWDIDAKVINGNAFNSLIDSVVVYVDDTEIELGKAKYAKGSFKMNLAVVPESELYTPGEKLSEGVTISDKNAKLGWASIFQGIKKGEHVGYFLLTKYTYEDIKKAFIDESDIDLDESAIVMYWYVDRDVTIKGTETYTRTYLDEFENEQTFTFKEHYNLTLKQGWNLIAGNILVNDEFNNEVEFFTLTKTDGYNWVFLPNDPSKMQAPRAKVFRK